MFALWRQSRFDYRNARGASHLAALEVALPKLVRTIASMQRSLDALHGDMDSLGTRRMAEFRAVLARRLVDSTTRGPPGVGPILWERVVDSCYDGTLGSLRNARGVPGIGDQRAAAIYAWVSQAELVLEHSLRTDFPGKREISERYDALLRARAASAKTSEQQLRSAREIHAQAERALRDLRVVRPATFRKAYKGEASAAEKVIGFHIGVFPPWREPPGWYEYLLGQAARERGATVSGASPIPAVSLAFLVGLDEDGRLVIEVRAQIEGHWVKVDDPLSLLSHGLTSQIQTSRITVAKESLGALLAIGTLRPRKTPEGRLSAELDPGILRYLRAEKCVREGDASKRIQILDEPLHLLAVVDFDPKDGLHIHTGYEIPGQQFPVPAEKLRATPDGRFVQVDGIFAPVPPPPGDTAAPWLKSPSKAVEVEAVPALLTGELRALQRDFRTILTPETKRIALHKATQLVCGVALSESDWLDLRLSYLTDGHAVPVSPSERIPDGFIRLGDFEWVQVDLERLEVLRNGLRRLGAQTTPNGYLVDLAALVRVEALVRQAGGQLSVATEIRRAAEVSIASRVPPFLFPDLSAFLARTVSRDVREWKEVPIQAFAPKLEQIALDARLLPDHIPPDLHDRMFVPFYPIAEPPGKGGDPLKRPSLEFLEESLVKLKRQLYGEEESRRTFDPRLEGVHRDVFIQGASYLECVLRRVEASVAKPYFCHVCGIYGESELLVLRRGDRPTCLWCSRGLLVIAQRFRSLSPRAEAGAQRETV